MKQLPTRQQDVLNAIVQLTDEKGFPPSLAELANFLGLKNRMTVHQHVAALKKKGLVLWESGLNRSLRVSDEGLQHVTIERSADAATHSLPDEAGQAVVELDDARGVPFRGRIAAGSPIDALESPEYLEIDVDYARRGCYALEVRGDSMIEDGIFDGDFVIVKPNPSPTNGEIVVALLEDGSATLKRFFKEKGGFRLQPGNSSMEPIIVDSRNALNVQGVVVGLFRRM